MAVNVNPISASKPLELTGERYARAAAEEVKHERCCRYFFASQFCDKRRL